MICKNCNQNLKTGDTYCFRCGAKVIMNRLQIQTLLKDWLAVIFNIDNKLLATVLHLFLQPNKVIGGYIDGLRKKYFAPINYLLLSFGLYGIYILIYPESGYFHEEFLSGVYAYQDEDLDLTRIKNLRMLNLPILIFQMPILALAAKWIYQKAYNYAENLVIASYWISHILIGSLMITLLLIPLGASDEQLGLTIVVYFFGYSFYLHRQVYRTSWFFQILKFMLYFFLSLLLLIFYFGGLGYFLID